jgi:hypothetical protein
VAVVRSTLIVAMPRSRLGGLERVHNLSRVPPAPRGSLPTNEAAPAGARVVLFEDCLYRMPL